MVPFKKNSGLGRAFDTFWSVIIDPLPTLCYTVKIEFNVDLSSGKCTS